MTTMIEEAAEALRNGELIVFPTDTVYGIGCDPFNEEAIQALYAVKRRPPEKSIPILVDSLESAEAFGEINDICKAAIEKHWPGALTIVVKQKAQLSDALIQNGTVALRMPKHDDLLELISAAGGAIAATSANMSGKKELLSYDEVYATFSESVAVVIPGSPVTEKSSTIVDFTEDVPKILREGPVSLT